jgi:antitoxin component of MazEF toxin-antitoxin module
MLYMPKLQENVRSGALLVQIPKAIVTAKKLKKGQDVDFLIGKDGRIILDVKE